MKKRIWYTYLIGWKEHDLWYYGYRGAVDPSKDLWVKYFTSSKCVKGIVKRYGDPDYLRIHKIFLNDEQARIFENKFLRKVGAVKSKRWLNQHDCGDRWVTKKGIIPSSETREKVSNSLKGKTWWTNGTSQTKSVDCPSLGWYRGRIKGQLSEEGRRARSQKTFRVKMVV